MDIVSQIAAFIAHTGEDHGHTWDRSSGWMWNWGLVMMIGMAVLAVVAVVFVVRGTSSARRDRFDPARQILAERYARGELTAQEYDERLEELR